MSSLEIDQAQPITINIRPMRMTDLEQVHAIDRLSFSLPWPKSSFRFELLENPASHLWVAEASLDEQKKILGMIVVWLILDEAHIATIAVHPEYRRQGIGSQLLRFALRESLGKGVRLFTLEVRDQNETAQALYRSFGFEIVGRRPRYYRDTNEDAILMSLGNPGGELLRRIEESGSYTL